MKSFLFAALLIYSATLFAQEKKADGPKQDTSPKKEEAKKDVGKKEPKEELSVTEHAVSIGGKEIKYTATTGTLLLKEEDGKTRASVFFIAYTRVNVAAESNRP